ncbi:MAG: ATP synthase F0 subunit C [Myxococcales bacterium]|nr:ATP synthase F0 subunit C [Myxococcales bacterium]MCB9706401.1 ATP synthase F0 subunit C [Myxococcales bacterium]
MTRKLSLLATFLFVTLAPAIALAAPVETTGTERSTYGLAMALAVGLAALGGGLGQGRAVAAALEGICRNPNSAGKVLVPMLLGLAFVESLVIFALIISFTVGGNIAPTIGT